jgi:hypothetical protein
VKTPVSVAKCQNRYLLKQLEKFWTVLRLEIDNLTSNDFLSAVSMYFFKNSKMLTPI